MHVLYLNNFFKKQIELKPVANHRNKL